MRMRMRVSVLGHLAFDHLLGGQSDEKPPVFDAF